MDTWSAEKEMKCKLKMDPMDIGLEDERWWNTADDYAPLSTLVLSVWKLGNLKPESQSVSDSFS